MHLKTRVLVTGGAGFLGRHLVKRLLAQENDVLCVDNFFTGSRDIDLAVKQFPKLIGYGILYSL
jgi:nucleoside-diphosphate-sugar epimerase